MRYSDDGEPQGTAGMPILEVLRRESIVDVAVVVTRYFGGILLGAGGLVRAYAGTAKLTLDSVGIAQMCLCTELAVEMPYSWYEQILKLLESHPVQILDTIFAGDVTLYIRMPTESVGAFEKALTELSSGTLGIVATGERFEALAGFRS